MADLDTLLESRLLLVTGKGGVGKSAVAAALGLAAARTGRRTCLVEVEGRQSIPALLETPTWDFDEREFRPLLHGMAIDPEASLTEYLDKFYGARRLSRLVVGSSALEFATTAAPGLKDVLLIGKVKELERRRDEDGRFHYDLVIVDAPPTGRIVQFLRAPEATTELVNVGPVRQQAQSLIDLLLDEVRTRVLLVTLLEEMPVTETAEGAAALRELGVALGAVMVNRVLPTRFAPDEADAVEAELDGSTLAAISSEAGLELDAAEAEELVRLGRAYQRRIEAEAELRERLAARVHLPLLDLPEISSAAFANAEVEQLADVLEDTLG